MAAKLNADTSSGLKLESDTTGILELQSGATTKATINSNGLTLNDTMVVGSVTETQTTKSASFTPNLDTEGTVFSCSGTMTITMPSVAAGKSFTIVHAAGNAITWAGTIKWNGGSAPSAAAAIEIYVFYSDGTNWYGMQSGTGFA